MVEPVEVVAADVSQGVGQFVGLRIAVADGRFKAVIVQLPVLVDDLLKSMSVILLWKLPGLGGTRGLTRL